MQSEPSSGIKLTAYSCICWLFHRIYDDAWNHKHKISTKCYIHTFVPPDDGPRYARNMQRLTKYTKNKLCIKWVFLYTRSLYFEIFSDSFLLTYFCLQELQYLLKCIFHFFIITEYDVRFIARNSSVDSRLLVPQDGNLALTTCFD